MCNWKNWILPGLLSVALLTTLAGLLRSDPVEKDLSARAGDALSAGHDWAEIALDGRDLALGGLAPSQEAMDEAASKASATYGVRVVDASGVKLLPLQAPYAISATRDGGSIILEGYAPDAATRESMAAMAAAAVPGTTVDNRLVLARGNPQDFDKLAGFGMAQLAGLSAGKVSLSDLDLSVTGDAGSPLAHQQVLSALSGTLPAGGRLATLDIRPPTLDEYVFSATRDGANVVLEGFVPDDGTRKSVLDAVAAAVPGAAISDNLRLALGQPDGFDATAAYATGLLKHFSTGTASLKGSDMAIRGTASSSEAYDEMRSSLASAMPQGAKIAVEDITPAAVSPYTWSISRDSQVVVLNGYAPDPFARSAMEEMATATFPDDRVVNRLAVAGGVPQGVDPATAADFMANQMKRLARGSASLSDHELRIEGRAATQEDYTAIGKALSGDLPGGITLASADISGPVIDPWVWSAESDGKSVIVDGYVPDADTASATLDTVRAHFPSGTAIDDRQKVGEGAPPNVSGAMSVAVQLLGRLAHGKAELRGNDLSLSGEALSGASANEIRAQARNALPKGFNGLADVSLRSVAQFVTPEACQNELDRLIRDDVIHFESGKSAIKTDSFGLLDQLAFAAQRCPKDRIEIGGHTDSDGSDDSNMVLSQDRANAVRDYLVRSGVFFSRLLARGYGETQPVANNSSAQGKARNRRISFQVIK
ncbi:MAG: OmpA family protein [Rhizobiaceae bacterium]